jgi:hypothetical protein
MPRDDMILYLTLIGGMVAAIPITIAAISVPIGLVTSIVGKIVPSFVTSWPFVLTSFLVTTYALSASDLHNKKTPYAGLIFGFVAAPTFIFAKLASDTIIEYGKTFF